MGMQFAQSVEKQITVNKGASMKVTPLFDKVLVLRDEPEAVTKGGILLPDAAKEKPAYGKVIAIGDGARTDKGEVVPMTVKEGDHILFLVYAGNDVKIGEEDYLIMRETDILAVID